MKALGASQRLVDGFFAAEAALLGVAGAIVRLRAGRGNRCLDWKSKLSYRWFPRLSVLPGNGRERVVTRCSRRWFRFHCCGGLSQL